MPSLKTDNMLLFAALCLGGIGIVRGQALCVTTHCFFQMGQCILTPKCMEVLNCLQECVGKPDEAKCSYACGVLEAGETFINLLKCMVENECIPKYEEDGLCLASNDESMQGITEIGQLEGDWWVLKGQNCGQDEIWRGAYDWLPCQHGRFIQLDDGTWINNTTYCDGKDSVCTSEIVVTVPKLEIIAPGVIRNDYPQGESPIVPQIEDWKFVAQPHPDWALVIWCGSNPILEYNGAFVISRFRSLDNINPEIEAELAEAAMKFGIDYDKMCVSDNTNCKE